MVNRVFDGIRAAIVGPEPITRISVTTFAASMCEIMGLYRKMKIQPPMTAQAQAALDRGTKVHDKLDTDRLEPVDVPEEAKSPALDHAISLINLTHRWQTLARKRSAREVPVFASYKGIQLFGIVDGFEERIGGKIAIVENKTTWTRLPPAEYKMRLAYHQTLTYHYIFKQMMEPGFDISPYIERDFDSTLPLAPDPKVAKLFYGGPWEKFTLDLVYNHVHKAFEDLTQAKLQLDPVITLKYSNKYAEQSYDIDYDRETEHQLMEYSGDLWLGNREPSPYRSDGTLFCPRCEYKSICEFMKRTEPQTAHI